MHLSKRLQMVADCVTKGNVVADVGCDHAYISIYLVENQIAPRTIALDVNEGPIQRATENVAANGFSEVISTRLSDGLEKLVPKEADAIVIAGMGGPLMIKILSEGSACVDEAKEVILQPQSEIEQVREYLHKINFTIIEEHMCIDEGKFYTVMHAIKKASPGYEKRVYSKFGELLLKQKDPVLKEFLEKEYATAKLIEHNLNVNGKVNSQARLEELKDEMTLLLEALSYFQ